LSRKRVWIFAAVAAALLLFGTSLWIAAAYAGNTESPDASGRRYLVKTEEGSTYLYDRESGERRKVPELVFDALPSEEQRMLEEGVWVADEQKLRQFLEDYIS